MMATDFWSSSHFKRWLVDRALLLHARAEDLKYVDDPDHVALLGIFFSNLITKLGTKLAMRQRVIATANVFFRRFYLKNAYCETDPYIVLAACVYVAAKAEESPVHIKTLINDVRNVFSDYGLHGFPLDNSRLAEMEFYLVDELECDLVVFHPYRTLMALVRDISQVEQDKNTEREAGELGHGVDGQDGPRYWGTGECRLELLTGAIQNAWFLINDTYRTDTCMLYPPHLIAIAALYIICVLSPIVKQANAEWRERTGSTPSHQPHTTESCARRSLRHVNLDSDLGPGGGGVDDATTTTTNAGGRGASIPPQDFVGFFANLNVNMRLVATIAQEMISYYALCDRLKEDVVTGAGTSASGGSGSGSGSGGVGVGNSSPQVGYMQHAQAGWQQIQHMQLQLQFQAQLQSQLQQIPPAAIHPSSSSLPAGDQDIRWRASALEHRQRPNAALPAEAVDSAFLVLLLQRMQVMHARRPLDTGTI